MSERRERPALLFWPAVILLAGAGLTHFDPRLNGIPIDWLPTVAAGVAPLVAFAVLSIVAPGFDRVMLATLAVLSGVGLATMLGLASAERISGQFYAVIAARQGYFIAAGFAALVGGAAIARQLEYAHKYPYMLLAVALALTAATMVRGETVNGARLWLTVGPVRFQPAEIGRLLIVIFVAVYLYERRHLLRAPWRVGALDLPPAPHLIPLVLALLGAVAVLFLQNDLGMAALIALGVVMAVFGTGSSPSLTAAAAATLAIAGAGAYVGVGRVQDRVAGWLDPWRDPAGIGFQFVQSDFALAAGGVIGHGDALALGSVPEVHTDLVLTAIGSQFGLIGALAVLALSALLVCRCILAALRTGHGLHAFVSLSLAALIAMQVILIAGGALRVLPLTGLTYPLVSYGGTSMLMTFFAMGIVLGIGAQSSQGPGIWRGWRRIWPVLARMPTLRAQ